VNPQVDRLIQMLAAIQAQGGPRLWELPPDVARRAADGMFVSMWNEGGPAMGEIRSVEIPGAAVPCRRASTCRRERLAVPEPCCTCTVADG